MINDIRSIAVHIDWQAVAGFAGALAIVYAALTARKQIQDFFRQHVSEKQVGLADEILASVYRAEKSFINIRNQDNQDFSAAYDNLIEYEGLHAAELRKIEYYGKVLEEHKIPFEDVENLTPRGRAYFGDSVAAYMLQISNCLTRMNAAFFQLRTFHTLGRDGYGSNETHPGLTLDTDEVLTLKICSEKYWPILQKDQDDRSQMEKQFYSAKSALEKSLLPILRQ